MSFLANYMEFNSGNEAPQQFHRWCGLLVLSAAASRRFWLDMGYFKVTPNLYVVLLGRPGIKKTTAMSIARGFVQELGVPMSAECQTKESLCKEWKDYVRVVEVPGEKEPLIYTPISIFVTELSHFLGANALGMMDFLTTVFDIQGPYTVKTKNKGSESVAGPYLTLCGCTTPDWVTTYLKQDIISGGFSRRCLFVLEHKNEKPIAIPVLTDEQRGSYIEALNHVKALCGEAGEFHFDKEGRQYYCDWYDWQFYNLPQDVNVQGYYTTKHIHLLKVAMLMALSEDIRCRTLTKPTLEAAQKLLEMTERNLESVYSGVGRNELNNVSHKLVEMLKANNTVMSEKQVRSLLWRDAQTTDIEQVLNYLLDQGKIKKLIQEREGRPPVFYYGLPEHVEELQKKAKLK